MSPDKNRVAKPKGTKSNREEEDQNWLSTIPKGFLVPRILPMHIYIMLVLHASCAKGIYLCSCDMCGCQSADYKNMVLYTMNIQKKTWFFLESRQRRLEYSIYSTVWYLYTKFLLKIKNKHMRRFWHLSSQIPVHIPVLHPKIFRQHFSCFSVLTNILFT